ncbi:unnamed protein product [Prorocentrum cordatum]|uniref:Uncharacterized protein n=1 Tax=Prorocentrum cordatum TaxID=2364126 RepID=A0ABN9UFD7_9DINO|nr:unnamed protein product [Polarella glacialis]
MKPPMVGRWSLGAPLSAGTSSRQRCASCCSPSDALELDAGDGMNCAHLAARRGDAAMLAVLRPHLELHGAVDARTGGDQPSTALYLAWRRARASGGAGAGGERGLGQAGAGVGRRGGGERGGARQAYGALQGWAPSEAELRQICERVLRGAGAAGSTEEACAAFGARVARVPREGGRAPPLPDLTAVQCGAAAGAEPARGRRPGQRPFGGHRKEWEDQGMTILVSMGSAVLDLFAKFVSQLEE